MNERKKSKGFALLLFGVMVVPLVGLVGLTIDTGVLYVIKSKLSAAVDAGSLAGARALSRGSDDDTQRARAQQVAASYVRANFPNGYMLTGTLSVPVPTVTSNIANQRSVSVNASVQAPTFFTRILGFEGAVVQASAMAVRRDVNVMLVIDRSRSLEASGSCDELRAAAIGFVTKFAPGRDNLGLVTYASSSFLEFPMGSNFAIASPTLETRIGNIICTGGTASADGLSRGYWNLAGLNQPAALNVILFFTDGQPTAITHRFTRQTGSGCNNANPTGVWTVGGGTNPPVWGLLNPSVGYSPITNDENLAPNSTGCAYAQNWRNNVNNTSDYVFTNSLDIWGNNLRNGYRTDIVMANIQGQQRINDGLGANVVPVATNAADDAALRIRSGAAIDGRSLPNVVIFGIGLGNTTSPASHEFMLRVTNDPRSPILSTTQREGLYIAAPTAADLNDAFTRLASEILRLAQ
jgi:Flp pilus assembly protein TadG